LLVHEVASVAIPPAALRLRLERNFAFIPRIPARAATGQRVRVEHRPAVRRDARVEELIIGAHVGEAAAATGGGTAGAVCAAAVCATAVARSARAVAAAVARRAACFAGTASARATGCAASAHAAVA